MPQAVIVSIRIQTLCSVQNITLCMQVCTAAGWARLSEAADLAHLLQHAAAALLPLQGGHG